MSDSRRGGRQLATAALWACAAGLLLLSPGAADAQGAVIRGVVTEAQLGHPIPGARLALYDAAGQLQAETVADSIGAFRMEASRAGQYRLSVFRPGVDDSHDWELEVTAGEDMELAVRLPETPVELPPLRVTTRGDAAQRVADFRRRAEANIALGRGRIYTREDIDAIRPRDAEALLATISTGFCNPVLRLNGMPAHRSDLRAVSAGSLEGFEYYRGLQIPREFEEPGICGVVLVWTRSDPEGMRQMSVARVLVSGALGAVTFLLLRR
jgi:hypothetical protein